MNVVTCLRHTLVLATGIALAFGCGSSNDDAARKRDSNQPGTCAGYVDRELHFCTEFAEQRDAEVAICEEDLDDYSSLGCGAAYATWLGCGARATWDCEEGPAGCDDEQTGYFNCVSLFVQRTGCTYTAKNSACPTDKPHTFGCLAGKPPYDTCVPLPNGGGADLYCCP